jgi:Phosphopantetheine attachment site
MDSLMAVELRDRLQRALGVALPATLAFDHPNIQVLVGHLLGDVLSLVSSGAVAAATPHGAAAERNELVDRIKGLSDDSIEKLIGDELDALDGR